jgi:hypothetical protein
MGEQEPLRSFETMDRVVIVKYVVSSLAERYRQAHFCPDSWKLHQAADSWLSALFFFKPKVVSLRLIALKKLH